MVGLGRFSSRPRKEGPYRTRVRSRLDSEPSLTNSTWPCLGVRARLQPAAGSWPAALRNRPSVRSGAGSSAEAGSSAGSSAGTGSSVGSSAVGWTPLGIAEASVGVVAERPGTVEVSAEAMPETESLKHNLNNLTFLNKSILSLIILIKKLSNKNAYFLANI